MKYLILPLLVLFTACSYKTTPVIVAFKKDNLAINDQGFLKENSFSKQIELYSVGQLIFVFKVNNNQICINKKCYNKALFIHSINPKYPSNLFEILLDKKPLPNIKIKKTKNGFIQTTNSIFYKVSENKVFFRDKQKHFLFLIKKIKKKSKNP